MRAGHQKEESEVEGIVVLKYAVPCMRKTRDVSVELMSSEFVTHRDSVAPLIGDLSYGRQDYWPLMGASTIFSCRDYTF
jgi:hypothetical protein